MTPDNRLVNEAAQAYRGVVPIDCWHEHYMPMSELEREIAQGIIFWVAEEEGHLLGVMGIQDKGAVALVSRFLRLFVGDSRNMNAVGRRDVGPRRRHGE